MKPRKKRVKTQEVELLKAGVPDRNGRAYSARELKKMAETVPGAVYDVKKMTLTYRRSDLVNKDWK